MYWTQIQFRHNSVLLWCIGFCAQYNGEHRGCRIAYSVQVTLSLLVPLVIFTTLTVSSPMRYFHSIPMVSCGPIDSGRSTRLQTLQWIRAGRIRLVAVVDPFPVPVKVATKSGSSTLTFARLVTFKGHHFATIDQCSTCAVGPVSYPCWKADDDVI